jgi:TolA-binding protein
MTLIPTSKVYHDYQMHLEQESRISELMQSNNLLANQVESQKRQIAELMDWVGTTINLLTEAQKEIRDLREDVEKLRSVKQNTNFNSTRQLK